MCECPSLKVMDSLVSISCLSPALETISLDVFFLSPTLNRLLWVKMGSSFKRNLFNAHPRLKRARFTLRDKIEYGFDWERDSARALLARKVNAIAYLFGFRKEDPNQ